MQCQGTRFLSTIQAFHAVPAGPRSGAGLQPLCSARGDPCCILAPSCCAASGQARCACMQARPESRRCCMRSSCPRCSWHSLPSLHSGLTPPKPSAKRRRLPGSVPGAPSCILRAERPPEAGCLRPRPASSGSIWAWIVRKAMRLMAAAAEVGLSSSVTRAMTRRTGSCWGAFQRARTS